MSFTYKDKQPLVRLDSLEDNDTFLTTEGELGVKLPSVVSGNIAFILPSSARGARYWTNQLSAQLVIRANFAVSEE